MSAPTEEKRTRAGNLIVRSSKGLLKETLWQPYLESYPTELLRAIRRRLLDSTPGLTEKFNASSRYFGY